MATASGRWFGTVPISIGVHLVVLLLLLIIPLVATDLLPPVPASGAPAYIRVAPLPPPPAPAPESSNSTPAARHVTTDVAPLIAPPTISPERRSLFSAVPDTPGAVPGGAPADVGLAIAIGDAAPPRAPEPARPPGPVRVADLPQPPVKIVDARPQYPEFARAAHLEGTVVIDAVIDAGGRIVNARVIKSAPLFDQAALDAVRQWRYSPTVYYGRPVSVLTTITVNFKLQ